MSNANPMFEHAKYSHTIVNPKPRNIRSDKKKDVKFLSLHFKDKRYAYMPLNRE